jgi:hypothetical protein
VSEVWWGERRCSGTGQLDPKGGRRFPIGGSTKQLFFKARKNKNIYIETETNKRLTPITLATWEAEIRRIQFEASPGKQFARSHLQNNQRKIDWRCDSSSRSPVLQAQSPEMKP